MKLTLTILPQLLGICRLAPGENIPTWLWESNFFSISKTVDELSIVCPVHLIPEGIQCNKDWQALKVGGPLDFSLIGILSELSTLLANEGISIFAISTFDTDYILVKTEQLNKAATSLIRQGHTVNSTL
ncbi:ACT domain-containing protein [Desulforamulus aeronauticus]|uniref:Uncharacterized protein n=1 Tax=Desulforamulus aeronauticus DSM 10349 TaxID=1121421 RepID=A0A1M6U215_9FIRM|nr:ACT domain-containing protein [Desulforamulus aeronauticus]SHK63118.1 hypothetical protein SAMN02745123_02563 [Desulforamulus aeronauticus DSM 10349]